MNKDFVKFINDLNISSVLAVITSISIGLSIVFETSFIIWNSIPIAIIRIDIQDMISLMLEHLALLFIVAPVVFFVDIAIYKFILKPLNNYNEKFRSAFDDINLDSFFINFLFNISKKLYIFNDYIMKKMKIFSITIISFGVILITIFLGAASGENSDMKGEIVLKNGNTIKNISIYRTYSSGVLFKDNYGNYNLVDSESIMKVSSPPFQIWTQKIEIHPSE